MADTTKMKLPFPLDRVSDEQGALDASAIDNMPAKLNDNGTGVQEASGTASGKNAHAEGSGTASGSKSHAEGSGTASGSSSHAEGGGTATAIRAHAEGYTTTANGVNSHVEGFDNTTTNNGEHAQGRHNVSTAETLDEYGNVATPGTLHSVGAGYYERVEIEGGFIDKTIKRNAEEITTDGKRYLLGVGGYDGTNATDDDVQDEATVINDTAKSIAPEYSASSTYAVDARVTYRGKMYKCKTAITTAEAWTASHWSEVDVDSYLTEFAQEVVQSGSIFQINEDGFAFVDNDLNIGVLIDADGIHAKNILESTTVES